MASEAAITAIKVDSGIKRVSYNSAIWKKAKFSEIMLYPQTTIKMNDKKANELDAKNSAIKTCIIVAVN
jgi:complex iron-sulfur molybdoenzyme family reductase subunit gamma